MQNSKLKNSIVLRGMSSNIVDEAIVILKPNVKIKNKELTKNGKFKDKRIEKNFIVQEAEHVILEYIEKINERNISNRKRYLENNNKILKISNIIFIIAFILSLFG